MPLVRRLLVCSLIGVLLTVTSCEDEGGSHQEEDAEAGREDSSDLGDAEDSSGDSGTARDVRETPEPDVDVLEDVAAQDAELPDTFELDQPDTDTAPRLARTELTERLTLRTAVPALAAGCELLGVPGASCEDVDQDGLVDAWEDLVLAHLRPRLSLDEAESLLDDPGHVLANVGRVYPMSTVPLRVRAFIVIGYTRDYGSCFGVSSHNGDSERVALDLAGLDGGGAGDVEVWRYYTAAHEYTVTDHSRLFEADDAELRYAAEPDTGEPRWLVFPSANKHATYASKELCESIAPAVPCMDEDCAPDSVDDPEAYTVLPPVFNAGEPDYPRLSDLSSIGFPGEDAWSDQDFCGGLARGGCASPVLEKLTNDPFPPE